MPQQRLEVNGRFQLISEPRARRDDKRRSLSRAKTVNEAVLPLILWGVSQETGLPGWLSALIKPDGFLTLNTWIDLYVASPNKVHILLRITRRWSARENKGAAIRLLRWGASQFSSSQSSPVLLQTRMSLMSLRCLYLLSWQSVRTRPLLS